jgi:hypothetical protein
MTVTEARSFIVKTSLIGTASIFLFIIVGKPLGYPIGWSQVQRVIEIVLPVFLGYLGSASLFIFSRRANRAEVSFGAHEALAGQLIKGSVFVFALVLSGILFAFGYSNRAGAAQDDGMDIDQFAWALTAVLGILNVSTNAAVSFLFSVDNPISPEDSSRKEANTVLLPPGQPTP